MNTSQLYDPNEETWQEKLHIGCGGIYLRGYTNIDTRGSIATSLADDELTAHSTTIREYYREDGEWNSLPKRGHIIVDKKMTMQNMEYEYLPGSVDKIVVVQAMEHLDPIDFVVTIDSFLKVLRRPGVLIVSVPDMTGTLDWIDEDPSKTEFAVRHLRGTMKDVWSQHRSWWTQETLAKALEWVGFDAVRPLQNFHCYPAIVMRGQKIG